MPLQALHIGGLLSMIVSSFVLPVYITAILPLTTKAPVNRQGIKAVVVPDMKRRQLGSYPSINAMSNRIAPRMQIRSHI